MNNKLTNDREEILQLIFFIIAIILAFNVAKSL
jgi:hypothetical protein